MFSATLFITEELEQENPRVFKKIVRWSKIWLILMMENVVPKKKWQGKLAHDILSSKKKIVYK